MKHCCICKTNIKLENFCKNKRAKDGLSSQCKDCAKKYREANKHKKSEYPSCSKEYKKEYYKINNNHINSLRRKKYAQDPNKYILQMKKSYQKNRSKRLLSFCLYYQNNKNKIILKQKIWRRKNIHSILLRNRARIKKIQQFELISQSKINKLLLENNNKCHYCGIKVIKGENLHIDHMIPLCKNGSHSINNLVPSCNVCNLKKGAKDYEEFFKKKG